MNPKLIAALFLTLVVDSLHAFDITVSGVYFPPGETPPTYTLNSLSGDSAASTWADSFAEWIQVPPFDDLDENDNPIEHWEIVAGSERTVFQFGLTGEWAGRQVSLSRDGGQTNFVHFYFGGLSFSNSDFSGDTPAVAPNVIMLGNYFTIGQIGSDSNAYPPYVISSGVQADSEWPDTSIDFIATRSRSLWRWSNLVSASDPRMETAMSLDADHRLRIYKHLGQEGISLDPIAGNIKINNQPVLTAASAATQFVGKSTTGVNLALGGTVRSQVGLPPQLVLGVLNDTRTNNNGVNHTEGVLIVGTGNATEGKRNGLRILDDGTVLIRPKDDLPMLPEFSHGPQP